MEKKNKSPQKEENKKIIDFTYEDWINEKHLTYHIPNTITLYIHADFSESLGVINISDNETIDLTPNPILNIEPKERKKIEKKQKEIFDQHVENALKHYEDRFLKRYETALEQKAVLEIEIKKITNIITNEKMVVHFENYRINQVFSSKFNLIDSLTPYESEDKNYSNPIVYLYQSILENSFDYNEIEPHFENDFSHRNNLIIAFTFYKYLKFLKEKLEEKTSNVSNSKTLIKTQPLRKRNDPTFLQLFRNDDDKVKKFISLLKSHNLEAIDENNIWIYPSFKSSIVACFEALKDLKLIREIPNKSQLYRVIKSKIDFEGTLKIFGNGHQKEDYNNFISKFEKHLK